MTQYPPMLDAVLSVDAVLRNWLTAHHNGVLDWLMIALSVIGRGGTIWMILGVVLAIQNRARARGAWQLILAVALAGLLVDHAIKPAIARPRPFDLPDSVVRLVDRRPTTASFPSGHAATAAAGAYAVSRIWPQGRAVAWTLAALIAFSRVYVGVHYPLDVVAGAFVGLLCAAFALGGTRWRAAESPRP